MHLEKKELYSSFFSPKITNLPQLPHKLDVMGENGLHFCNQCQKSVQKQLLVFKRQNHEQQCNCPLLHTKCATPICCMNSFAISLKTSSVGVPLLACHCSIHIPIC
jgi:hypothetical protein